MSQKRLPNLLRNVVNLRPEKKKKPRTCSACVFEFCIPIQWRISARYEKNHFLFTIGVPALLGQKSRFTGIFKKTDVSLAFFVILYI